MLTIFNVIMCTFIEWYCLLLFENIHLVNHGQLYSGHYYLCHGELLKLLLRVDEWSLVDDHGSAWVWLWAMNPRLGLFKPHRDMLWIHESRHTMASHIKQIPQPFLQQLCSRSVTKSCLNILPAVLEEPRINRKRKWSPGKSLEPPRIHVKNPLKSKTLLVVQLVIKADEA